MPGPWTPRASCEGRAAGFLRGRQALVDIALAGSDGPGVVGWNAVSLRPFALSVAGSALLEGMDLSSVGLWPMSYRPSPSTRGSIATVSECAYAAAGLRSVGRRATGGVIDGGDSVGIGRDG